MAVRLNPSTDVAVIWPAYAFVAVAYFSFYVRLLSDGRFRRDGYRDTEIRPNTVRLRNGRFGRSPSRERGYIRRYSEQHFWPADAGIEISLNKLFVSSYFVSWLRRDFSAPADRKIGLGYVRITYPICSGLG